MTNDDGGWTPSIPETPWTVKALQLYQTLVDDVAEMASDAARTGAYEDATTLAILSDVLQKLLDDGALDEAFDVECEERYGMALSYMNARAPEESLRERQDEARRLKR